MKKSHKWLMFSLSITVILPLVGCQYNGNTCTLSISKECPEEITNLYIEYGNYYQQYGDFRGKGKFIKVGDITTDAVRVKCIFEKQQPDDQVGYRAYVYYQKDGQWMQSYFLCGSTLLGCYSDKFEIKIYSDKISDLGFYFWSKRWFKASEPISKPIFIIEQKD